MNRVVVGKKEEDWTWGEKQLNQSQKQATEKRLQLTAHPGTGLRWTHGLGRHRSATREYDSLHGKLCQKRREKI